MNKQSSMEFERHVRNVIGEKLSPELLEQVVAYQSIQSDTRRTFLSRAGVGLGALAMSMLSGKRVDAATACLDGKPLAPKDPPQAAKAKRVIYIHLAGSPRSWNCSTTNLH